MSLVTNHFLIFYCQAIGFSESVERPQAEGLVLFNTRSLQEEPEVLAFWRERGKVMY